MTQGQEGEGQQQQHTFAGVKPQLYFATIAVQNWLPFNVFTLWYRNTIRVKRMYARIAPVRYNQTVGV